MRHPMNSKQKRSANSKGSMKKLQNVRSFSIHHHILVFRPFSNQVNLMLRCVLGLTNPCMALSNQFLLEVVITTESLEDPLQGALTDIPRVETLVEGITTLTVPAKVEAATLMPLTHNRDVDRLMVQAACQVGVHEVVEPVVMEEVGQIINKVVLMLAQAAVGAQT